MNIIKYISSDVFEPTSIKASSKPILEIATIDAISFNYKPEKSSLPIHSGLSSD